MLAPLPTTDRLALREMDASDAPALASILTDPVAMVAYEGAFTDAEVDEWLRRQRERYAVEGFGLWAAELRETGEMVGQCGLTTQVIDGEPIIEVGYLFARRWWHQGFATEAARACRDWAFEHVPVDVVCSKIRDTNLASMNVAIRNGMTARRRILTRYRGVDMPHLVFAITRDEWMLRSRPPA
jgi:RimJ/RimL family protein N-acetyltransferase